MPADFLPQFPLQLVVFPNEKLNLHIFEPRYRQLVRECADEGTTFGIPAYINNSVQRVGTELKLLKIEKIDSNGEMDIKTQGIAPYAIRQFYNEAPGKLYSGASIQRIPLDEESDLLLNEKILEYLEELFVLLNIDKELPGGAMHFNSFDIGHYAGLSIQQEYDLLCIPMERERQTYLLDHFEKFTPMVREMNNLRERALMNGHFKNIIPPNF
jgi:hypothetical protein